MSDKRRYDPEASRSEILDAAERLFAERGFGDVSTGAIAKAAGVSQSQIHYHFETKKKLWNQVFQQRLGEYFARQKRTLETSDRDDGARMAESIRAYFELFQENPHYVKLLSRALLDQVPSDDPTGNALFQQGVAVIEAAQQKGHLRADVAPAFILVGFFSLVTFWFQCRDAYLPAIGLPDPPASYDAAYLDFVIKVYLQGIAP